MAAEQGRTTRYQPASRTAQHAPQARQTSGGCPLLTPLGGVQTLGTPVPVLNAAMAYSQRIIARFSSSWLRSSVGLGPNTAASTFVLPISKSAEPLAVDSTSSCALSWRSSLGRLHEGVSGGLVARREGGTGRCRCDCSSGSRVWAFGAQPCDIFSTYSVVISVATALMGSRHAFSRQDKPCRHFKAEQGRTCHPGAVPLGLHTPSWAESKAGRLSSESADGRTSDGRRETLLLI